MRTFKVVEDETKQEPAGMTLQAAEGSGAAEAHGEPAALPAPAPAAPEPAPGDASFPSPHVIYLGVVKNELDAQLMRFRNGLQMLTAKINGAETIYQDAMRALDDETKRKREELNDTRLSEVTRLRVQIGDLQDVIETYEAAIAQASGIEERQEKAEADAAAAIDVAINAEQERHS